MIEWTFETYGYEVLLSALILVFAFITHEYLHWLILKKNGVNAYIKYDGKTLGTYYTGATKEVQKLMLTGGIWGGWIVMLFLALIFNSLVTLVVSLFYFVGCKSDLKELRQLRDVKIVELSEVVNDEAD